MISNQPELLGCPPDKMPSRDWKEDFNLENGNYQNHCIYCEHIFLGYKRRLVCKRCDWLTKPTPNPNPDVKELLADADSWLAYYKTHGMPPPGQKIIRDMRNHILASQPDGEIIHKKTMELVKQLDCKSLRVCAIIYQRDYPNNWDMKSAENQFAILVELAHLLGQEAPNPPFETTNPKILEDM